MDAEREIALQKASEELHELLEKEGPKGEHQCTLFESSKGEYYLATGGKMADGRMMYIINSHLWYDYDCDYMESRPWKVLYKAVKT